MLFSAELAAQKLRAETDVIAGNDLKGKNLNVSDDVKGKNLNVTDLATCKYLTQFHGGAFEAYLSSAQTVTPGDVKVNLNAKSADIDGWFDVATHRFMPRVQGVWLIVGFILAGDVATTETPMVYLRRNGQTIISGSYASGMTGAAWTSSTASGLLSCDGVDDYLELWGYAPSNIAAAKMQGIKVA